MKGFKTLIFGALVTLLGSLQAADIAQIVPAEWTGLVMAVIGAVTMALRTVTSTPVMSDGD